MRNELTHSQTVEYASPDGDDNVVGTSKHGAKDLLRRICGSRRKHLRPYFHPAESEQFLSQIFE